MIDEILAAMAAIALTVVAPGADDDKPTPDELREAEVYRLVDKMIERRDKMLPRFAVVLYGEGLHDSGRVEPLILARAKCDERDFELIAHWHPDRSNNEAEVGNEYVRIGDDHFASMSMGFYLKRDSKQPIGQFKSEFGIKDHRPGGHDPFDDWISINETEVIGIHKRMESMFYGVATHVAETREGIGGQLIARMAYNNPKYSPGPNYKEEIVFSRAHGGMPVRATISEYDPVSNSPPMEQRVRYKRHLKHGWLPYRFQWLEVHGGGQSEYTMMAYWLVGKDFTDAMVDKMIAGKNPDELPDEALAILQSYPDKWTSHLAPLLDHFKIPRHRAVGGTIISPEHKPPEGLYDD